jgi:hypothetical protein
MQRCPLVCTAVSGLLIAIVLALSTTTSSPQHIAQAANCKDENGNICFLPPTANYYDNVLQLYKYNGGPRWALEYFPGHPPYNSGSKVVQVGNGWYTNVGNQLNVIRNEISASPDYNKIRPWITIGGLGPYDQDQWRNTRPPITTMPLLGLEPAMMVVHESNGI